MLRGRLVSIRPADTIELELLLEWHRDNGENSFFLDAKNRPTGWYRFCGGLAFTVVKAADVFRAAVIAGARAIVLVHNHPSGDPCPSSDDVVLTDRMRRAGEIIGIDLLDHVVLGDGSHYSFLDAGLLS